MMHRDAIATLREWAGRLLATVTRRRTDQDLEDELRSHLELAAEHTRRHEAPASNVPNTASRPRATAPAMDALRDQRGFLWLDDLARDVRHALRLLRRSPVFAGVTVLSIGLGIGANVAMFSLADALLLRPLPVPDPGAVLTVSDVEPGGGLGTDGRMSYPNYRDLRSSLRSFDGLTAYRVRSFTFARSPRVPPDVRLGASVSDNFFSVLGVQPAVGRAFTSDEGKIPGRAFPVVLGYVFWKHTLGGDPAILGTDVWINRVAFRIVGVMPESFSSPLPPLRVAFYVPVGAASTLNAASENPLEARQERLFRVRGRLAPGVSRRTARTELATAWERLKQQYPEANRYRAIALRTGLEDRIQSDPWDAVLIAGLLALAAVVLIIACANVANLLLGRAGARAREVALRLALGVSRARLLRQLLTESLVLAGAGLGLGLAAAYGGIRFLQTIPGSDRVDISPQLDLRALVFASLIAVAATLLFGAAPARQSLRTALVPGLRDSRPDGSQRTRLVGRKVLVVAQVALSMVLLVATGMLVNGFMTALKLDPGFRTDGLLMLSFDTSLVRSTGTQTDAFYRDLIPRAEAIPGVASATLTSVIPLQPGGQESTAVVPQGYVFPPGTESATIFSAVVDERYFATMQIQILRGRGFTAFDRAGSRRVAVVNEAFARTYWPGEDALGKRLRLEDGWVDVVGVARTATYTWVSEPPTPFLYLPFAQHPRTRMSLLVATTGGDPALLATPLRGVVRSLDADQPVFAVETFSNLYHARAIVVPRMVMQIVAALGLLGTTLALVGLYGLVAYAVARRTREIGIRMAVGAGSSQVLRMVLRQGLLLSGAGIVLGTIASAVVAPLLSAALLGLAAPSAATFVIAPAALVALTLAASYVPARRASLVDPLVALREE